jgi:hypothetical protein
VNTDDEPNKQYDIKMMPVLDELVLLKKLAGCGTKIVTSVQLSGKHVSGKAMALKRAEAPYTKNNKLETRERRRWRRSCNKE